MTSRHRYQPNFRLFDSFGRRSAAFSVLTTTDVCIDLSLPVSIYCTRVLYQSNPSHARVEKRVGVRCPPYPQFCKGHLRPWQILHYQPKSPLLVLSLLASAVFASLQSRMFVSPRHFCRGDRARPRLALSVRLCAVASRHNPQHSRHPLRASQPSAAPVPFFLAHPSCFFGTPPLKKFPKNRIFQTSRLENPWAALPPGRARGIGRTRARAH